MKKFNKMLALSLSAFLMFTTVTATSANPDAPVPPPVNEERASAKYVPFEGVVTEFRPFYNSDEEIDSKQGFYIVEDSDGNINNLQFTESTHFLDGFEPKVGDKIIGFYNENAPSIMIAPPQRMVIAIAESKEDRFLKLDFFDEMNASSDNTLKLNLSNYTETITETNETFEGPLENKTLLVVYDVTTRSIPAQTTPKKIVVFFEKVISPIIELPSLTVSGELLDENPPIKTDEGIILVAIRAITDKLDISLEWNNQTHETIIDKIITIKSGTNEVKKNSAKITLDANVQIIDGKTYVPISFLKEVLDIPNVEVSGVSVTITK